MYVLDKITIAEKNEVLDIYHSHIGSPGCTWDSEYPSEYEVNRDIAAGLLYCFRDKQHKPAAVVSIEPEPELSNLPFWRAATAAKEIARIAVRRDLTGQGLAFQLLTAVFKECKKDGTTSIRLLVSPRNVAACALYKKLGFIQQGTADMYERHWLCMDLLL